MELQDIEKIKLIVSCDACQMIMKDPMNYIGCDHKFCRRCLKCDHSCLLCKTEERAKLDNMLNNVIKICTKLLNLPSQANGIETPPLDITIKQSKTNLKGETPLHQAAIKGDLNRCKEVINTFSKSITPVTSNKNCALRDFLDTKDNAGWAALHEACNHGNAQIVSYLVSQGASVDILGPDNLTPLHDAITNEHIDCVRILLESGADTNIKTTNGENAYDLASPYPDIRKLLESYPNVVLNESHNDNFTTINPGPISNTTKIVLLTSGKDESNLVGNFLSIFTPLKVIDITLIDKYHSSVTHLICFNNHNINNDNNLCQREPQIATESPNKIILAKRTVKYLMCALTPGCWILNEEWLKECISNRHIVNEQAYQITGCSNKTRNFIPLSLNTASSHASKNGIFCGFNFYLKGRHDNPNRIELIDLIKLSGAEFALKDPSRISTITLKNNKRSTMDQKKKGNTDNTILKRISIFDLVSLDKANQTNIDTYRDIKTFILCPNEDTSEIPNYSKHPPNFFDYLIGFYGLTEEKEKRILSYYKYDPNLKYNESEYSNFYIASCVMNVNWFFDSISYAQII